MRGGLRGRGCRLYAKEPRSKKNSCGGAVCILFGGMRLLNSEEKERSKEVQARGKAEREAKKKTKREPARAAVRTGRLFCSYLGEIPPNKSGWWTNNRAVAGDLY